MSEPKLTVAECRKRSAKLAANSKIIFVAALILLFVFVNPVNLVNRDKDAYLTETVEMSVVANGQRGVCMVDDVVITDDGFDVSYHMITATGNTDPVGHHQTIQAELIETFLPVGSQHSCWRGFVKGQTVIVIWQRPFLSAAAVRHTARDENLIIFLCMLLGILFLMALLTYLHSGYFSARAEELATTADYDGYDKKVEPLA